MRPRVALGLLITSLPVALTLSRASYPQGSMPPLSESWVLLPVLPAHQLSDLAEESAQAHPAQVRREYYTHRRQAVDPPAGCDTGTLGSWANPSPQRSLDAPHNVLTTGAGYTADSSEPVAGRSAFKCPV